ncbi:hypothetical protein V1514DRAFT_326759 [Lipomyces japonicus]|uniref:uncharacterized protein n=1 Tax=Lipomyces japonicus TaxID=56871 RepID=UPI0034CF36D3
MSARSRLIPTIETIKHQTSEYFLSNHVKFGIPTVFRSSFINIPASSKWVCSDSSLNVDYFKELVITSYPEPYVSIEKGNFDVNNNLNQDDDSNFARFEVPFLTYLQLQSIYKDIYLAQTPLLELIPSLQSDIGSVQNFLPSNDYIYGNSAWIGRKSFTPRHYDANDNLYIMITGSKKFTLWEPSKKPGELMLCNANFRAAEDKESPWGEVVLNAGDGIYIPQRWWHEVKGCTDNTTISLNWWFHLPQVYKNSTTNLKSN